MKLKAIISLIVITVCLSPIGIILASEGEKTISHFENGSEGWHGPHHFADGYNSQQALRITNPENGSVLMYKNFNVTLLRGYNNLELDLRTKGGNLLPGDASALAIEQGGWKWVSLSSYMQKDNTDWQHLVIPLSDFSGLKTEQGISNITFRFWNYPQVNHYIDNIKLTTDTDQVPQLNGYAPSPTTINLSWQGTSEQYNIYLNNQKISTTNQRSYSISDLSPATQYTIYIKGIENEQENCTSNSLILTTPELEQGKSIISDFEVGHPEGWRGIVNMDNNGYFSKYSMRISNPAWGSADAYKDLKGAKIAQDYNHLELDINLQGAYLLPGDASALYFDQGGWKWISLEKYVQNGVNGWQHISIPLSDFDLDAQEGIAKMGFRFWNYQTNYHLIDNITLTNK